MPVKCYRQARPTDRRIYLTFDDGPDPNSTDAVLAILAKHKVTATFFVIADQAEKHRDIISRILASGHAIGNHSLNHRYRPFFAGRKTMKAWIQASEEKLRSLIGTSTIGWRSPAGIQTPPLHSVLKELDVPLIHWDTRFYDAVKPWTWDKAERSLTRVKPGSIILLHDKQRQEHRSVFLSTLDRYILSLKACGFQPVKLETADLL